MENGEPPRTPLTNEEKTLLSGEMTKIEAKLAEIYNDLNTDEEEFPELIQKASTMIFAEEHQ
jgi:hypothetical protein